MGCQDQVVPRQRAFGQAMVQRSYDLIGEKVNLRLTPNMVEVFFRGSRVAMHVRSKVFRRDPVVKPEHMPMEHRMYLGYNEKEFNDWANTVGPNAVAVVKYFLTCGKEPEQGHKYCASLTKLSDRYGPVRLENACKRLLSFSNTPSIRIPEYDPQEWTGSGTAGVCTPKGTHPARYHPWS